MLARMARAVTWFINVLVGAVHHIAERRATRALAEWCQALGLKVRPRAIAHAMMAALVTGFMVAIYLLPSVLPHSSGPSLDLRLQLLASFPPRLLAHLTCGRDTRLNCLRTEEDFRASLLRAMTTNDSKSNVIRLLFRGQEPSFKEAIDAYNLSLAVEPRWRISNSVPGLSCLRHHSEVVLDTLRPDPPPPGTPVDPTEPPLPHLMYSQSERGDDIYYLADYVRAIEQDLETFRAADGPVPFSKLTTYGGSIWANLMVEGKIAPPTAGEIAVAARRQAESFAKQTQLNVESYSRILQAQAHEPRLAYQLLADTPRPWMADTGSQLQQFVSALLALPQEKVIPQNMALTLILTHAHSTAGETLARHAMEIREHLLDVYQRLRWSFGQTVAIDLKSGPPDASYFQSEKIAALLARFPAIRIAGLEVCTHVLRELLPFNLDRTLGLNENVRSLMAAVVWYPLNSFLALAQELREVLSVDTLAGTFLIVLALAALAGPVWYQVVSAQKPTDRIIALIFIVLLFPVYFAFIVAAADLVYRGVAAATTQYLALATIPAIYAFTFLFSKVLKSLQWLSLRFRARRLGGL